MDAGDLVLRGGRVFDPAAHRPIDQAADVRITKMYPPTMNDETLTARMAPVLKRAADGKVAEAPPSQEPLHDESETIASIWVRPVDALARWKARELQMFPPTIACLRMLAEHASVAEAMSSAASMGVPPRLEPRLLVTPEGRVAGIRLPGEAGFDEAIPPDYVVDSE